MIVEVELKLAETKYVSSNKRYQQPPVIIPWGNMTEQGGWEYVGSNQGDLGV